MGLDRYKEKRDFRRTPEPRGEVRGSQGRLYLIQKHAARALHYDLRLELGGVLKSWAVPKGPSLDPAERRLAVHVEDHPVEYGAFEGIIPAGEYGGGTVQLWDRGVWEPLGDPEKEYRRGRLKFRLHGEKLRGIWTLARMKGKREEDGNDNWLLIKHADEEALAGGDGVIEQAERSVATGRTMAEIASEGDRVWHSRKEEGGAHPHPSTIDPSVLPGSRPSPRPDPFLPQLATLVDAVPEGEEWIHEIKLDGYRLLCVLEDHGAKLLTRRGQDWTERFLPVAAAATRLPVKEAILDGEVVVLGPEGISDFQALQNVLKGVSEGRLVYYVFDLPHCQGYDLTRTPLIERKNLLRQILSAFDPEAQIRFSDHIRGEGERVYRHACRFALEGIVSKRADSPYVQRRTRAWVKVKCLKRQEFVIGGFSEPSGSRSGFGALLVGYWNKEGELVYAGKVGTGFNEVTLRRLEPQLRRREAETPPFIRPPRGADARGVHWIVPDLVAEIEFTEWTGDGRLRHPSFKGLREGRGAEEVRRERPEPLRKGGSSEERGEKVPGASKGGSQTVAGVSLSNPDRIMFPEQGVTKAELALYYERVADHILPFIAGRPLTVVRCPQGRGKKCFYQKHLNEGVPPPVRGVTVAEKEGEGLYLVIDDLPGLLTLVQLGVLEFHPWGSRVDDLERPDMVIFDLDPGPDVGWDTVVEGALLLRSRLEELGFESFVKTSGGKGLHIVLPLTRRSGWDDAKAFTRAVAEDLDRRHPKRFVTTMTKSQRGGRIFIDFFRNGRGATSVAPYSTRARQGCPISTPLFWDELPSVGPADFTIRNISERLSALEVDPWGGFFRRRQSITQAVRRELRF